MEKSVQFCQMGLRRDFFITFNVLQAHLLKTLYYCTFDTKRIIRGYVQKGARNEKDKGINFKNSRKKAKKKLIMDSES